MELLADKHGFLDFFKDLGYDYAVFEDVFDMLQYANLPFGEKRFTRTFFENEYYTFPDDYFPSRENWVTSRENYIDTLSSHPNILNRRLEMRKIVGQFSNPNASKTTAYFEKEFEEARMLAQFESINQLIIKNNHLYAYYNACALQDIYPQQTFLKQAESAALYALYRFKATTNYDKMRKSSQLPGGVQFLAHVLEKMSRREFAVWTVRTLWNALQVDPANDYTTQIFNDMVMEVSKLIGSLNQFSDYGMTDTLVVEQIPDTNAVNKGRFDRYKERIIVAPSPNFRIENYMLADLKQDPDFLDAFALGILTAERAAVDQFISKHQNKTKEKALLLFSSLHWN
jgi:hypothetical protein